MLESRAPRPRANAHAELCRLLTLVEPQDPILEALILQLEAYLTRAETVLTQAMHAPYRHDSA